MSDSALVRSGLPGWWKITSFHVELEDTGERLDTFGHHPLGHLVVTDDRMISILTSNERAGKDAAGLFETMIAYAGSCHLEDAGKLVIKVDSAWHPAWVGSEQVRFFSVEGHVLSMTTAWQTHPNFPGRTARGVLKGQRL